LQINHNGDRVILKLTKYPLDEIIFGSYVNAYLPVPKNGQSIVNHNNFWGDLSNFGISNTPTPGYENHFDQITLTGNIYDKWGHLFTSPLHFTNPEICFYCIDNQGQAMYSGSTAGSYKVSIVPRKYSLYEIQRYSSADQYTTGVEIEYLSFDASVPDTTIIRDIHFKYFSGLSSDIIDKTTISVFPNPCKIQDAVISYSVPDGTKETALLICDMSGKILFQRKLSVTAGEIKLADCYDLISGTYIVSLTSQGRVLKTTRLINLNIL